MRRSSIISLLVLLAVALAQPRAQYRRPRVRLDPLHRARERGVRAARAPIIGEASIPRCSTGCGTGSSVRRAADA